MVPYLPRRQILFPCHPVLPELLVLQHSVQPLTTNCSYSGPIDPDTPRYMEDKEMSNRGAAKE